LTTALGRIWDQLRPVGLRFSSVGGYGDFEVRAEIPGVDPTRDIQIWLAGGGLRVEVTRAPTRDDRIRSEFHYGRLSAAVDLPSDVDVRRLSARYHRGVLRIASAADGAPGTAVAIGSGRTTM
jgi:HSP20 family molecular chaperone IbpA